MKKTLTSAARLNNGIEMPYLGLGVYLAGPGSGTENAVQYAFEAGYRHIDTASLYGNEREVGRAVRNSRIPREEIFITTKLWNSDHGYNRTITACEESLRELNLPYIDLYLIHWPVENLRNETWEAMIALQKDGKCRAIGVSNYTIRHLEELLADSPVVPAVNQVEFSPFLYQKDLLDFCRSHGIQLEAYSPLTRGKKLNHPAITSIAARYGKTSAQIMIRWSLEHEIVVIPKSANKRRIYENADVFDFEITHEDLALLDSLNKDCRFDWDPSGAP
ncbi:MAG: aldo/keto reductase [Fidelibacterota bacterium]|nr:MAG: aldo/keto reductase [Candidatus Neomarinimicrobiota bacterium]